MRKLSVVFFCIFFLSACASAPKWSDPKGLSAITTPQFHASIVPAYPYWDGNNEYAPRNFSSLTLRIENKTDKDFEIDWNHTLFIHNGATNSGFSYRGIILRDRDLPRKNDIIIAGSTFTRNLTPNALTSLYCSKKRCMWTQNSLPNGENGVFLTLIIDGKKVQTKMSATIMNN